MAEQVRCSACGQIFQTKRDEEAHEREMHSGAGAKQGGELEREEERPG